MNYFLTIITFALIYLISAQGLNITFGLGKIFNLAHMALFMVGAYATALVIKAGYSFVLGILAGVILAVALAWILGKISIRISDEYFAIATLAFHQVIVSLSINWFDLTRGPLGIHAISRPLGLNTVMGYMLFVLTITVVIMACLYFLFHSKFARTMRAIGENEVTAKANGKDVVAMKYGSFILGSICAAIAGGLMAVFLQYVDPNIATIHDLVFTFSIVILARMGSFWGVFGATFFLTFLSEIFRFIKFVPTVYVGPLRQIMYAVILFAIIYIKREKIFPKTRTI